MTNDDQNVQVLSNGSLEIVAMKEELAGQYSCVAGNMVGTGRATLTLDYLGEWVWLASGRGQLVGVAS